MWGGSGFCEAFFVLSIIVVLQLLPHIYMDSICCTGNVLEPGCADTVSKADKNIRMLRFYHCGVVVILLCPAALREHSVIVTQSNTEVACTGVRETVPDKIGISAVIDVVIHLYPFLCGIAGTDISPAV